MICWWLCIAHQFELTIWIERGMHFKALQPPPDGCSKQRRHDNCHGWGGTSSHQPASLCQRYRHSLLEKTLVTSSVVSDNQSIHFGHSLKRYSGKPTVIYPPFLVCKTVKIGLISWSLATSCCYRQSRVCRGVCKWACIHCWTVGLFVNNLFVW